MGVFEEMTPGEIVVALLGLLLAAAAAINQLGNAAEKIAKAWRAAKAPNDEQNARLDALEKWKEDVDRKLDTDHKQLEGIHDGLRAIYQSNLALLDHGIDGNNIKQMEDAKTVLLKHLTSR